MKIYDIQGGFKIVKTDKGGIYQYAQMFYGNWKLWPPVGGDKVRTFKTEEEILTYLKDK